MSKRERLKVLFREGIYSDHAMGGPLATDEGSDLLEAWTSRRTQYCKDSVTLRSVILLEQESEDDVWRKFVLGLSADLSLVTLAAAVIVMRERGYLESEEKMIIAEAVAAVEKTPVFARETLDCIRRDLILGNAPKEIAKGLVDPIATRTSWVQLEIRPELQKFRAKVPREVAQRVNRWRQKMRDSQRWRDWWDSGFSGVAVLEVTLVLGEVRTAIRETRAHGWQWVSVELGVSRPELVDQQIERGVREIASRYGLGDPSSLF